MNRRKPQNNINHRTSPHKPHHWKQVNTLIQARSHSFTTFSNDPSIAYSSFRKKQFAQADADTRRQGENQVLPVLTGELDAKFLRFLPDTHTSSPDTVRLTSASDFNLDFDLELQWQQAINEKEFIEGSSLSAYQKAKFEEVFQKMAEAKKREFQLEREHLEAVKLKFNENKKALLLPQLPNNSSTIEADSAISRKEQNIKSLFEQSDGEILDDYYGYGDILREVYESSPASTSILNRVKAQFDPSFDKKSEELISDLMKQTRQMTGLDEKEIQETLKKNPQPKQASVKINAQGQIELIPTQNTPPSPGPHHPLVDAPKTTDSIAHLASMQVISQVDLDEISRNQAALTDTGRADRFDNFYDDDEKIALKQKLYLGYNTRLYQLWEEEKEALKNFKPNIPRSAKDYLSPTERTKVNEAHEKSQHIDQKEDNLEILSDDEIERRLKHLEFNDNDANIDSDGEEASRPYYAREEDSQYLQDHLKATQDPEHKKKYTLKHPTGPLDEFGDEIDEAEEAIKKLRAAAAKKKLVYTTQEYQQKLEEYYASPDIDPTKSTYTLGETVHINDLGLEKSANTIDERQLDMVVGEGNSQVKFDETGENMIETPESYLKQKKEEKEKIEQRKKVIDQMRRDRQLGNESQNKEHLKNILDDQDKEFFNQETGELYTSRPATRHYIDADNNLDPEFVPETIAEIDQVGKEFMNAMFTKGKAGRGIGSGDSTAAENVDSETTVRPQEKLEPLPRFTTTSGISRETVQMHPMDYMTKFVKCVHPDLFSMERYNIIDDKTSVSLNTFSRTHRDEFGREFKQERTTPAEIDEYMTGQFKRPGNIRYYTVDQQLVHRNNTETLSALNTLLDWYKSVIDLSDTEKNDPFAPHLQTTATPKKQLLTFFIVPNRKKVFVKPINVKKGVSIWDDVGKEIRVSNIKSLEEMNDDEIETEKYELDRIKQAALDQEIDGVGIHEGEYIDKELVDELAAPSTPNQKGSKTNDVDNTNQNDSYDQDGDDNLPYIRTVRVWFNPPNHNARGSDPRDLTNAYILSLERCMVEVLTAMGEEVPIEVQNRWRTEIRNSFVTKVWAKKQGKHQNKLDSIFSVSIDDLNAPTDEQLHNMWAKSSMAYIHLFPYANKQREADFRSETHPRHHLFNALLIGGFLHFDKSIPEKSRIKTLKEFNGLIAENYQHLDCHRWWSRKLTQHDLFEDEQITRYLREGDTKNTKNNQNNLNDMFPEFDLDRNNIWPNASRGEHFSLHFSVNFIPQNEQPHALITSSNTILRTNAATRTNRLDVLYGLLKNTERKVDSRGDDDGDEHDLLDSDTENTTIIETINKRPAKAQSSRDHLRNNYLNSIVDGMYGDKRKLQQHDTSRVQQEAENVDYLLKHYASDHIAPSSANDACLQVFLPTGLSPDRVQAFLLSHAYILYDEWKYMYTEYRSELARLDRERDEKHMTELTSGKPIVTDDKNHDDELFTLRECVGYFSTLQHTPQRKQLILNKLKQTQPKLFQLLDFYETMPHRKYKKAVFTKDNQQVDSSVHSHSKNKEQNTKKEMAHLLNTLIQPQQVHLPTNLPTQDSHLSQNEGLSIQTNLQNTSKLSKSKNFLTQFNNESDLPIGDNHMIELTHQIQKLPQIHELRNKVYKLHRARKDIRKAMKSCQSQAEMDALFPTFVKTKALHYTYTDALDYEQAKAFKLHHATEFDELLQEYQHAQHEFNLAKQQDIAEGGDMDNIEYDYELDLGIFSFIKQDLSQPFNQEKVYKTHKENIQQSGTSQGAYPQSYSAVSSQDNRASRRAMNPKTPFQPETGASQRMVQQLKDAEEKKKASQLESVKKHALDAITTIKTRKQIREKVQHVVLHGTDPQKLKNISMDIQLFELGELTNGTAAKRIVDGNYARANEVYNKKSRKH